MNKEELIKILRSNSNDIKDVLRIQNNLKDKLFENLRNLKNKDDSVINTDEIIQIIFVIHFTYKLIYSIVTRSDGIPIYAMGEVISTYNLFSMFHERYIFKKNESNYDSCKSRISNSEREILSSEHAIEFLNSITEEELSKYLSYKM